MIRKSISGLSINFNKVVSIKNVLSYMDSEAIEEEQQFQEDDGDLVDEIAAREWRQIFFQCQKYRKNLVSINFPHFDG